MPLAPPVFEDLSDYYKSYREYLPEDDLLSALDAQTEVSVKTIASIPPHLANYSYAPGKWMAKEIVGHLSDTERILTYRALRFSRNDKTELQPFDEDMYLSNSNFRDRSLSDILNEWKSVRAAGKTFFASLNDEMADRKGLVSGNLVSARIILYFIIVHERHHLGVIKERYMTALQR